MARMRHPAGPLRQLGLLAAAAHPRASASRRWPRRRHAALQLRELSARRLPPRQCPAGRMGADRAALPGKAAPRGHHLRPGRRATIRGAVSGTSAAAIDATSGRGGPRQPLFANACAAACISARPTAPSTFTTSTATIPICGSCSSRCRGCRWPTKRTSSGRITCRWAWRPPAETPAGPLGLVPASWAGRALGAAAFQRLQYDRVAVGVAPAAAEDSRPCGTRWAQRFCRRARGPDQVPPHANARRCAAAHAGRSPAGLNRGQACGGLRRGLPGGGGPHGEFCPGHARWPRSASGPGRIPP